MLPKNDVKTSNTQGFQTDNQTYL